MDPLRARRHARSRAGSGGRGGARPRASGTRRRRSRRCRCDDLRGRRSPAARSRESATPAAPRSARAASRIESTSSSARVSPSRGSSSRSAAISDDLTSWATSPATSSSASVLRASRLACAASCSPRQHRQQERTIRLPSVETRSAAASPHSTSLPTRPKATVARGPLVSPAESSTRNEQPSSCFVHHSIPATTPCRSRSAPTSSSAVRTFSAAPAIWTSSSCKSRWARASADASGAAPRGLVSRYLRHEQRARPCQPCAATDGELGRFAPGKFDALAGRARPQSQSVWRRSSSCSPTS